MLPILTFDLIRSNDLKEELLEKNDGESEFDLISDIIDSLGHEEAAEEKDAEDEESISEEAPEENDNTIITDEKETDKTPDKLKSFGSRIKNSVRIDPDTLKDMFFGSNITEKKPVGQQETEFEEDEPQILGKRKKKADDRRSEKGQADIFSRIYDNS